jgi:hypothetical protein
MRVDKPRKLERGEEMEIIIVYAALLFQSLLGIFQEYIF